MGIITSENLDSLNMLRGMGFTEYFINCYGESVGRKSLYSALDMILSYNINTGNVAIIVNGKSGSLLNWDTKKISGIDIECEAREKVAAYLFDNV